MQDQDRIAVFLSYLGFVGLLPPYFAYFSLARSPYARFHAQQGVYLTTFFLAGSIFFGVLRWLGWRMGWQLKYIYIAFGVWFFLYIFLNLLAAIFGLLGRRWRIPLVGSLIIEPPAPQWPAHQPHPYQQPQHAQHPGHYR